MHLRNTFLFSDINRNIIALGRVQTKWILCLRPIAFILWWMLEKRKSYLMIRGMFPLVTVNWKWRNSYLIIELKKLLAMFGYWMEQPQCHYYPTKDTQVPPLDRSAPFMNDIAVSKDGVIKLLKGLNPSKALGPDELHPRVLKELATELGPVFAHLFQQSIDTGEVPKEWSVANICPLFKKSDRSLTWIITQFPWLVYLASYSNT